MRQAGMKPKNHSSGTYWIRANAGNETKNKTTTSAGLLLTTILTTILLIILASIDKLFF